MLTVFAPATSANLNVGFDNLGVALRPLDDMLGDEIRIEASDVDRLVVGGPYAPEIRGANIVALALDRVRQLSGRREPVAMELYKGMPVGSGLGSSAASVVAAVRACNLFYGNPLDQDAEKSLMGELEATLSGGLHWDNILPCVLGGLRLGSSRLPVPADWIWLIAYPGIRLETRAMRAVLPASIPLHDAVEQAARLGHFVDALYRGDGREAARLMVDPIVEPCRSPRIPGFDTIKAAMLSAGGLAAGISGSGPTMFALFDDQNAAIGALERARLWTSAVSGKTGEGSFSRLCVVDDAGVRIVQPEGKA